MSPAITGSRPGKRNQAIEDISDVVGNRRSQPRNCLIDTGQPLLELIEDASELRTRGDAFHHVALEPTGELLMSPRRDRLAFLGPKP